MLGEGEEHETTLLPVPPADPTEPESTGLLARFDPEGRLIWARRIAATMGEGFHPPVLAVSPLPSGDFMVLGGFVGRASFGEGEARETHLVSGGNADFWLVRYRADGTLVWARRDGGPERDVGRSMVSLDDESVVVTGTFVEEAVFGSDKEGETELLSPRGTTVFIARYWTDGSLRWVRAEGAVEMGHETAARWPSTPPGSRTASSSSSAPDRSRQPCPGQGPGRLRDALRAAGA